MARILVIDDEPEIRTLLAKLIGAEGHEVIEAADAASGFAALSRSPDAVFVDVSMPGETGTEFLLRMRLHPTYGRIPAMFVTAHGARAEPLAAAGIAGPRLVTKPFRRDDIREALSAMLRSHRRRLDTRVRVVNQAVQADLDGVGPEVVKNLSLGGLYAVTRVRRPVGDAVHLMILHGKAAMRTVARVTHRGPDGLGLAYVNPGADFLAAVSAAIEDMLSQVPLCDDRREAARINVNVAIVVAEGNDRTQAELKDLSASGAFVVTPSPPPIGARIYLYLPGYTFSEGTGRRSELRGCLAEVVRHSDGGFGCRFIQPTAEFRMAAQELMHADGKEILVGM
ncbi:MAG: PilZ domain-containing protein [Deltaproteobacteria bacterium]|nr:PilZ domain-containing protein [Deltaproteobacteria bacterium]